MTGPCPQSCGRVIDYRTGCKPCRWKATAALVIPLAAAFVALAVLP